MHDEWRQHHPNVLGRKRPESAVDSRPERRTYVRRQADAFSAGVLRGEVSRDAGEWIEIQELYDEVRKDPDWGTDDNGQAN